MLGYLAQTSERQTLLLTGFAIAAAGVVCGYAAVSTLFLRFVLVLFRRDSSDSHVLFPSARVMKALGVALLLFVYLPLQLLLIFVFVQLHALAGIAAAAALFTVAVADQPWLRFRQSQVEQD